MSATIAMVLVFTSGPLFQRALQGGARPRFIIPPASADEAPVGFRA
jgi:hypothetical protein